MAGGGVNGGAPGGGLMNRPTPSPLPAPGALPAPTALADALKGLGLTSLARAVPAVLETARQQQWAYETFLHQALGTEVTGRAQRAYERRVRAAHLPATKSLESFDFAFQPTLSQRLIQELGTL